MRAAALRFTAAGAVLGALLFAAGARASDVDGIWEVEDGDAHVKIWVCEDGLCGDIVWLKEPSDREGWPRRDQGNEDPRLRDRPLLGVELLQGFRRTAANRWEGGLIYNPRDGQTYRVDVEILGADSLKIRGCQLIFCGEELWRRVK